MNNLNLDAVIFNNISTTAKRCNDFLTDGLLIKEEYDHLMGEISDCLLNMILINHIRGGLSSDDIEYILSNIEFQPRLKHLRSINSDEISNLKVKCLDSLSVISTILSIKFKIKSIKEELN